MESKKYNIFTEINKVKSYVTRFNRKKKYSITVSKAQIENLLIEFRNLKNKNMPEINQNHPELAKHLSEYVNEKHTQEECVGFSDGFKKANELANEDKKLIISKLNQMTLNYEDGQDLERQILELIKTIEK